MLASDNELYSFASLWYHPETVQLSAISAQPPELAGHAISNDNQRYPLPRWGITP